MAFSAKVKEEALLLSARHCCVCHRYKGVKLEVHHITPSAEGGSDSIENAIVLCFDCHTDAGHYNSSHPRGSKFSRAELRAARERWHKMVEAGKAEVSLGGSETLQTRYLICKNINIVREIVDGDLSNFPLAPAFLVETEVLPFLRAVLDGQRPANRRIQVWGDSFSTAEEYMAVHPGAEVLRQSGEGRYMYFEALREVDGDELRRRVAPEDAITSHLLDADIEPENVCRVATYYELCGDDRIQEIYILRPLWLVVLAVTNVGSRPIRMSELRASSHAGDTASVTSISAGLRGEEAVVQLPRAEIGTGETVVVPIATLLPDFAAMSVDKYVARSQDLERFAHQLVYKSAFPESESALFDVWGPSLQPFSVSFNVTKGAGVAELHGFDPGNTYTIDRYWEMGSCPHGFLVFAGHRTYWGELFARSAGVFQDEALELPPDCLGLEIVELEDEEALVMTDALSQQATSVVLRKGDSLFVARPPSGKILLRGAYFPLAGRSTGLGDPMRRNELVRKWISGAWVDSPPATRFA